ncbi:MAG: nuclear transport factor 2 family protein [Deltaproteobacteria bacterium]|nr:nuclear transport factor 2 family protein [Deltaproteobacteria bacterium]
MSLISCKKISSHIRVFIATVISMLAVTCLMNCNSNSPDAASQSSTSDLTSNVAGIEGMIGKAEAIRAIKRLQCAYGQYAEFGLWDDLADLFASDGIGHYPVGDLKKEEIRKLFINDIGGGKLGLPEGLLYPHIMLQPVVTLAPDGKSAKGRWRVFTMLGFHEKNANWAGGVYENEYIKEDGVWKIKDLRFYLQYSGPYEQPGWTIAKGDIPIHYTPDLAGAPAPMSTAPATSVTLLDEKGLKDKLKELLMRGQRLNDQQEVENLQHIYGYYVDRKMWDDVADLFTEDGTMEYGLTGVYTGRKSIRHALDQFGPKGLREGELNDHLQVQTLVNISPDGKTAWARGSDLIMSGKYSESGEWGLDVFENEYVKEDGTWRIRAMHTYPVMRADYDKGWVKGAKPAPGINKAFPPDLPSTATYEIFPKYYIPSFHYNNPVTGLSPRYPEGVTITGKFTDLKSSMSGTIAHDADETAIGDMEKIVKEVKRLTARAIGYDACENLTSAYGYYIDDFLWDDFSDLFAVDGWREAPFVGIYIGRERIRKSLKEQYPFAGGRSTGFFTAHHIIQPVINVSADGKSASIRVRLFQLSGSDGKDGVWMAGILEKKARIENDIWKLTAMDLDYTWTADYKGGWAKGPMSLKLSAGKIVETFPPDKPMRGPSEAPFPKIVELPFHYVNPVSGRRPPLLLE